MNREYYSDSIQNFLNSRPAEILGILVQNYDFQLEETQRDAWQEEIQILQNVLIGFSGEIFFEFSIPRMGKRIDVLLLIGPVIFILEFKTQEKEFSSFAVDQVWDYALDLKNFHKTSHDPYIAPILIATKAKCTDTVISTTQHKDRTLIPIKSNCELLHEVIKDVLLFCDGEEIDAINWKQGSYQPTPTIIEAAIALYTGHSVKDISRSDANAKKLKRDDRSNIRNY